MSSDLSALLLATRHCDWISIGRKAARGGLLKQRYWFCKICKARGVTLSQPLCPISTCSRQEGE